MGKYCALIEANHFIVCGEAQTMAQSMLSMFDYIFFCVTTLSTSKMTLKICFELFCFLAAVNLCKTIKTLSNPAADLLNRVGVGAGQP